MAEHAKDINGRTLKVGHIVRTGDYLIDNTFVIDCILNGTRLGLTLVADRSIGIYRQACNVRKLEIEELI